MYEFMVSIQKIFFGKKYLKKTASLNNFVSLQKVYYWEKNKDKIIEMTSLLPIFLSVVLNKLPI